MADILISKFTTQIPRVGATPATPGFAESEGQDPTAPSGTPQVYTPVTIGSPANGLSIDGSQVLTIGLASTSATGALSSTDWNTFNNKLNLTSPITGYTVGANTALADTDTILQAFGKVQGQINARISGTIASGQVAFGTGVNTVGGSANLTYINAQFLTIGGTTSNNGITLNGSSSFIRQIIYQVDSVTRWIQNINQNNFSISRYNASGSFIDNALSVRLSTGFVGIGEVTNPTNTLDVNGTARIRTISNLGSAATNVLVPSATGVISLRTLAEFASDAGLTPLSGLTTNRFIKATSATTVGNTGVTEESAISYLFGTRTVSTSATPLVVSFGGTVGNNTVGTDGNLKWKLFDDGVAANSYGIGMSGALMEIRAGSSGAIGFFTNNGTDALRILSNGDTQVRTGRRLIVPTMFNGAGGPTSIITSGSSITLDDSFTTSTTTPFYISTGPSFGTNTVGSSGNLKVIVFDSTTAANRYGIGLSGGLMEIRAGSTGAIGFFTNNGVESYRILSNQDLQFVNGADFVFGTTTGTQIGTATNQRLAFYGSTPIVKPSGDILTALSNLGLIASPTITQVDQFAVKTTASADQTLPSGVLTILDYDTTLTNNSTATYTVGTTGRITINTTGIYTITAGVVIEADAVTALESAFLGIFRNGDLVAISSINTTIAAGAQSGLSTSTILSLTATDIIDCRALVNSVGGVANGLARRLGTLLGANATQVNSLSITKNSM